MPFQKKILLVEDSLHDKVMLEALLSESFRFFETTNNLDKALVKAQAIDPDLILLDLNLPDSNGIETFRELNRLYPNRIVVLSGIDDIDVSLQTIEEGALDFINKNELLDMNLINLIRKCLSRKKRLEMYSVLAHQISFTNSNSVNQ